ncbi:MAG: sulfur carrier protein ThiS [Desulfomonilaceae bacterium]
MRIVVNGEDRSFAPGLTVHNLLLEMGIVPETIIVEHNGQFVQRSEFKTTAISDGDSLELIQFVGGG